MPLSADQRRSLLWLAEAHRENDVAGSEPPDAFYRLLKHSPPWAERIFARDFELPYEPRCLAVSRSCRAIAVGTKAGTLFLVRWQPKTLTWKAVEWPEVEPKPFEKRDTFALEAIRAVGFLDDSTLLVGSRAGGFRVLGIAGEEPLEEEKVELEPKYDPRAGWFRRFTGLVVLIPPGRTADEGPLALGLTEGVKVHLLRRIEGRYSVRTDLISRLFPEWPQEVRLIDGVWERDRLWLLGSDRRIYRYRWEGPPQAADASTEPITTLRPEPTAANAFKERWGFLIAYPHETTDVRRLAGCRDGLALLVADHIAFLPFLGEGEGPDIDPAMARWATVDQASDLAAWAPYRDVPIPDPTNESILSRYQSNERPDPFWVVAGSFRPGLSWLRWSPRPGPRATPPYRSLRPHASPPHHAGVGQRSVLLIRVGHCGDDGPDFLVSATRDHRLRINSLIHKHHTEHILDDMLPQLLSEVEDRDVWKRPGVAQWLARARLLHDLGVQSFAKHPLLERQLKRHDFDLLRHLSRADLRRLTHILLQSWRKSKIAPQERGRRFKRWVRRILQRASQLPHGTSLASVRDAAPSVRGAPLAFIAEETASVRIARRIYERIAARRSRDVVMWGTLGPFAGFLRKWIIHGHTYGTKTTGWLGPARWNWQCHYDLDALVYLAKLIRQRLDSVWEAKGSPTDSPTWDLVADPGGGFSIQSFTDGSITAVCGQGKPIPWVVDRSAASAFAERTEGDTDWVEEEETEGDERFLLLTNRRDPPAGTGRKAPPAAGLCLTHRLAKEFLHTYRHGSYARRLALHQIEGSDHSLLLFCFRGWRHKDITDRNRQSRSPRLCALMLRPKLSPNSVESLHIVGVKTREVSDELYGICLLGGKLNASGGQLHYLIGTRGSWQQNGGHWKAVPFIEVTLTVDQDLAMAIDCRVPKVEAVEEGQRTVFRKDPLPPEKAHNPCWSLEAVQIDQEQWLWAGCADERIRCYKHRGVDEAGTSSWIEGGGHGHSFDGVVKPDQPRDRSLLVSGTPWNLLAIQNGDQHLLAYGTAAGVVGLVSLNPLRGAAKPEGDEPGDSDRTSWVHLLHSREGAPICGLLSYHDEGKPKLATLSQDGYLAIYHLTTNESRTRISFPGLWQDRFPLPHTTRAMAQIPDSDREAGELQKTLFDQELPALLIATGEGRVLKRILALPRGSKRRRRAAIDWCLEDLIAQEGKAKRAGERATTPTLARCVGTDEEELYAWMRLLNTGGPEMFRFSVWHQLHDRAEELEQDPTNEAIQKDYFHLVEVLATEAYARRPFGQDPARIIWEEVGKVANRIAVQAITTDPDRAGQLLEVYNRINIKVDDLCNRWIGFQQSIEARVLIHSFNVLFDWPDIVLLAWLNAPENAAESREFLLYSAVQRRLNYDESMVRLETLRVLNTALRRAVFHIRRGELKELREGMHFGLVPVDEQATDHRETLGYLDLMILVGDLAERHHQSLSIADPQTTEITRFFSLSLLLIPRCALIIGQTMSESRLMERGPELPLITARQAEALASEMKLDHDGDGSSDLLAGLRLFRAYCQPPTIDLRPGAARDQEERKWLRLMTEPDEDPPATAEQRGISDAKFHHEQRLALHAAIWLARLDAAEPIPESREAEAKTWLEHGNPPEYFSHSHRLLGRLHKIRKEILRLLGRDALSSDTVTDGPEKGKKAKADSTVVSGDPASTASHTKAIARCDRTLEELETSDIFEPQRSQYRQVVLAWRDQIEYRAERAVEVLEAIDKFNRHVYRRSADSFMTDITELAMQVAPLCFDRVGDTLLRRHIDATLESHPLIQQIFKNGTRLVEQTHLAGTLLAVARSILTEEPFKQLLTYEVTLGDIRNEIEEAAKLLELELDLRGATFSDAEQAPASRAVWQTVLHEWATNVKRHASPGDRTAGKLCYALITEPAGGRNAERKRRGILLSGTVPFRDCLESGSDEQQKLERLEKEDPEQAARFLQELAEETGEPGRKLHIGSASSSGMGMVLILKICEFVGLDASPILFQVGEDPGLRTSSSATQTLGWPLCLEISWPEAGPDEESQ